MKELKTLVGLNKDELTAKTVIVYLNSEFWNISGKWNWEFSGDVVLCSDVMFSLPVQSEAVRSIIHPDDVQLLGYRINSDEDFDIEFRIITTYGEVREISGEKLKARLIDENILTVQDHLLNVAIDEKNVEEKLSHLQLLNEIHERNEKLTNTGIWWYNNSTNESWYSGQVFHIHGLPPHSLNAHLNTFSSFIHEEDREVVNEFVNKSHKLKIPLQIQYRINAITGIKWVYSESQWIFNAKGENVLTGIIRDITELKQEEERAEEATRKNHFYRQQIFFDEQNTSTGHWEVNLVTRKTIFSDNYYRIFGLKRQSVMPGLTGIINYIHPEDRDLFAMVQRKMILEHTVPEIEFRVIRSDGKIRNIIQKAKLVAYGDDMIMTGTIQDITTHRMLEKKISELNEAEEIKSYILGQSEEMSGLASWIWDLESQKIQWSNHLYVMLGYKPGSVELNQKLMLQFVHPDDKKTFGDEMKLVLFEKGKNFIQDREFHFRLVVRGKIKYIKARFRVLNKEGNSLFIATMQDVSNEYVLQHDLNHRMQLAEALSENILDQVIITDINNTIIAWNRPCETNFGIKKEDAEGKNFFDVFPYLKTEEEIGLMRDVLKGKTVNLTSRRSFAGRGYHDLHMQPLWSEGKSEVQGIIHIIHDVTRETELRKNLDERLHFIENLVESSIDRVIAMDRNLNYLVWNRKCEEFYHLKKEEVIGKNVLEVFPAAHNSPTYEQFRQVLKGQTIHISADKESGEGNYYEVYLIPVKDEKGIISAILWIHHDLNEEYNKEMELRTLLSTLELKNKIYSHAEDIANMGTWTWDPDTNESAYSDKLHQLFGLEPGELRSGFDAIKDFIHPEDRDRVLKLRSELNESPEPIGIEFRVIRKDGEVRFFRNKMKLISGENGKRIYVGTTEDITDRVVADERMKEHRDMLAQTAIASPDSITIYDLRMKQPFYLNNCLSEWTGHSNEALISMGYQGRLELVHPDDRTRLIEFNELMLSAMDGEVKTVEYRLLKDNELVYIRNRSKIFKRDHSGVPTHILSVLQNITEEAILKFRLNYS